MARYLNYLAWPWLLALCFSLTVAQYGNYGGGGGGGDRQIGRPPHIDNEQGYIGGDNAPRPGSVILTT
ncbi:hypothetical protein Hamer_G031171, partial [Homarus americanus]